MNPRLMEREADGASSGKAADGFSLADLLDAMVSTFLMSEVPL